MTELSRAARDLIRDVGNDDGPTAMDRARVRHALAGALAGGATLAGTSAAAGAAATAKGAGAGVTGLFAKIVASSAWVGGSGTSAAIAWGLIGGALGVAVAAPVAHYTQARAAPAMMAPREAAPPLGRHEPTARDPSASGDPRNAVAAHAVIGPRARAEAAPRGSSPSAEPARRAPGSSWLGAPVDPASEARAAFDEAGISGELALLKRAQHELAAGQAANALRLLDQHAEQYPRGALSSERTAVRVFALCALGRGAEARAAASEFTALAPESPLVPRVRASCAGDPGGSGADPRGGSVDSKTDAPGSTD